MTRGGNACKDEEIRTAGSVGEIVLPRPGSLGVESALGPLVSECVRSNDLFMKSCQEDEGYYLSWAVSNE